MWLEERVHARLVVVGQDESRQFELQLPAVIGRSRSTDVTLGDAQISRRHCEVFEADGRLMLRDLGSLNGTFVGEQRLADEPMPLEPGARFTLGPVTLQAEYDQPDQRTAEESTWNPVDRTLDAPISDKKPDDSDSLETDDGSGLDGLRE
ncbi:MAG: FHA domain-containing protein [Planctomycetota bacterium]|nr:MAG: FHA domain-containing protein [Planctomycetota bacterium]